MVNPFDKITKERIVQAIGSAEDRTSGEIRVHVRGRCGEDPLPEAKKVFRRLGMHRTEERNGVLLFVAWKSRRFAIIGDEGIHARVGEPFWNATRDAMASAFAKDDIAGGIEAGIRSAGEQLKNFFPVKKTDKNELPDRLSEGK